jgi:hypothetical protein
VAVAVAFYMDGKRVYKFVAAMEDLVSNCPHLKLQAGVLQGEKL